MGHWYPSSSWKCQGMGSECYIWFVSHAFPLYHPAANSLSSPGTLLLVGTQQGKLFLKYCFPCSPVSPSNAHGDAFLFLVKLYLLNSQHTSHTRPLPLPSLVSKLLLSSESYSIAQAVLKLGAILLPQPSKYWNFRHQLPLYALVIDTFLFRLKESRE